MTRSALRSLSILRFILPLALAFLVSACDSPEERAEEHYQAGLALLEAGDPERALVEFRNVFKLNGNHRDARATYARTVLKLGKTQEAYSQYLRLVEQYPQDIEARRTLAELAFLNGNWAEFERHGSKAIELAPDDPQVQVIAVAEKLRQAVLDKDRPAQEAATAQAAQLAGEQPDNVMLTRMLIVGYLQEGKFTKALEQIDRALERDPDNRLLYEQKLSVLNQLREADQIETVLKEMTTRFADDVEIKRKRLQFYMALGRTDDAEAFLREIADPSRKEPVFYTSLISFLVQQHGRDAALKELDTAIAANPQQLVLHTLRAGLTFDSGNKDKAIADLEAVLAKTAKEDPQLNQVKVTLATMLENTGNEVGARRLVEEVLSTEPTNPQALKIQARWQIQADQVDEAIFSLRQALDNAPDDVRAMALMAQAHRRAGNQELARDFLSLAAETSGNAPEHAIRFAQLLIREERYRAAEDTLLASLKRFPNNTAVLDILGQLYLRMDDIPRAQQVLDTLKRSQDPAATTVANGLELSILSTQNNTEESLEFLGKLAEEDNSLGAKARIIQTYLSTGQSEEARRYAETLLEESPEDPARQYLMYMVNAAMGQLDTAADGFRSLVADDPRRDQIWLQLFQLLQSQGKADEAQTVLSSALKANPEAPNLLWAKATTLEAAGDIPGAIEIYEQLYERGSSSVVVANNLASLLTTYYDDAEHLERAYNIARRLRGTQLPAFQDTYGWIAYRRGEYEEALEYLSPAAAGLPNDGLIAYHLGMTLLALDRKEDALAAFQDSVKRAGEIDIRPQIQDARDKIRELQDGGTAQQ